MNAEPESKPLDPAFDVPPPEDFAPTPKIPPKGFELFPQQGSAWLANLMLALIVFSAVAHWNRPVGTASYFTVSGTSIFERHEYWRLFTALGGHGDVMHLLHNAPIFWFFSWLLTAYFGVWVAGPAVLLMGVLSNLFTIWLYDAHVQLLGASGMIYGMVSLWLVLYIRFDRNGWWVKRFMRSFGFALLVLFPQTYERGVSYLAHASGFGIGVIAGLAILPFVKRYAPVLQAPYYQGETEDPASISIS